MGPQRSYCRATASATARGSSAGGSPRACRICGTIQVPTARTRPSFVPTRRMTVWSPTPARSATAPSVIWSNGRSVNSASPAS